MIQSPAAQDLKLALLIDTADAYLRDRTNATDRRGSVALRASQSVKDGSESVSGIFYFQKIVTTDGEQLEFISRNPW